MDTVVFTATFADVPASQAPSSEFRALLRDRFQVVNDLVREITGETGALCLDVASDARWAASELWSADGVHPSRLGHRRFAASMAELLHREAAVPLTSTAAGSETRPGPAGGTE